MNFFAGTGISRWLPPEQERVMGKHEREAVKEPLKKRHQWKQGDSFQNKDGGWTGSIVAVEGDRALVRYSGEDPRNIESVSLDSIKIREY